jgi:hypothetical protein
VQTTLSVVKERAAFALSRMQQTASVCQSAQVVWKIRMLQTQHAQEWAITALRRSTRQHGSRVSATLDVPWTITALEPAKATSHAVQSVVLSTHASTAVLGMLQWASLVLLTA